MKYIGKRVYDERGSWKTYLGSGIYLSRAIKKYGADHFSRQIIDVAETTDELNEKEKYWIAHYDAVKNTDFYNIAPGGDGGNVRAGYSDEEYRISEERRIAAVKNNHLKGDECDSVLSESDVLSIIPLLLEGEHTVSISRQYGVAQSTIADIRKHRTWKHLTDGIVFPPIKPIKPTWGRPVDAFDLNGNFIATYSSAREAEKDLGVGYKMISRVCKGERPHTHGYRFCFSNNSVIT